MNQFLKEGETCDLATMNTQKPIEDYWLTVFKNASVYMGDKDHEVLKHLTNVFVTENKRSESETDVTIQFKFTENAFFSNTELSTTLTTVNDMPKYSKGTAIQWKDGKDLCKKTIEKSQKNKRTGQKRVVKKEVKCKSIFGLFADFTDKVEEEESYNEEEEEQPNLYLLTETVEQLQDVVPFSLEYYLGVIENEDDDFEDEEGDEEDDDEEDEEDDKKKKKPAKAPKKADGADKPAGAPGPDGKQEECKKQ